MIIPHNLLNNKKILLGVTGSIASYKSLELVRLFVKAGADVKVIMSESAKKFVTPLTFETLTTNKVLDDTNESWTDTHNHIKIAQWADIFLVAPATANTLAKLANGIADTILLQSALAFTATKIVAPAANTNMLLHPMTQENMYKLQNTNHIFVGTQTKELACKIVGDGAMAEPIEIFWATAKELLKDDFWSDRTVFVTGGGTIEKIDEVRYLSNFSSGKMASALATALYCKGADVHLIASRYESDLPESLHVHSVITTQDITSKLHSSLEIAKNKATVDKVPYLFMAAAVSDYIPAQTQDGKLKKEQLGDVWHLELQKNSDILKSINKEGIKTIGFKAEMDVQNGFKNATKMLQTKNLDAVCLNILADSTSFGSDTNSITFITPDTTNTLETTDKLSLSFIILQNAKKIGE